MKLIIGFSKPQSKLSFWADIISWAMGTKYDHVYIRFELHGRQMVYQASRFYVNLISYDLFQTQVETVKEYELDITFPQFAKLIMFMQDTLGESYDFRGLFGMAWVLLGRKLGYKWINPSKTGSDYFCSELVCAALMKLGYSFEDTPEDLSPQDIENWLIVNKIKQLE